ncbi:uncharacterized TPR repeat-containing protein-like protein [Tanacetum coccineum]|uniref:Uncharacterized TPR repeat-containing protein-like protein n=1 Tax=Tanacetum coccineum TaxID=301880 RepID=A0ABQ5ITZ1_9ASTR
MLPDSPSIFSAAKSEGLFTETSKGIFNELSSGMEPTLFAERFFFSLLVSIEEERPPIILPRKTLGAGRVGNEVLDLRKLCAKRCEKVRKIFKRFDFNGDGGLNGKEMASYLAAVNLEDQPSEKKMTSNVNNMFQTLGEFVDGEKGLSCAGLIKNYENGEDNLDAHFKLLKLR